MSWLGDFLMPQVDRLNGALPKRDPTIGVQIDIALFVPSLNQLKLKTD
jgi:hypothetical protein